MITVREWSGREAKALRHALRLSVRAFAEHLGVAVRTVSKWEALGPVTQPRPDTQSILDTALARADPSARSRFESLVAEHRGPSILALQLDSPQSWTYETWSEDLERVIVGLSRQSFVIAHRLLDRWLTRYEPAILDTKGLYLYGRSLALQGDLKRDQGKLEGPGAAQQQYQHALQVFHEIDIPRRAAQIELSLAVVGEMAGKLEAAARKYQALSTDSRLSPRDRARAQLWVGTSLSKDGKHEYAAHVMSDATQAFERLDEPDDWSVAHQKMALAYRGSGNLKEASRLIEVSRESASATSPMQQVRLDTAHGHILLSDPATRENGLSMLDGAAELARMYSLTHQLTSIEAIRRTFE